MRMRTWTWAAVAVAASMPSLASAAQAQHLDERLMPARSARVGTPEQFALELRGGPYRPEVGPPFEESFGGDRGPMLAMELDVLVLRIPYVGHLGIGSGVGWSRYSGRAEVVGGGEAAEETSLTLVPVPIMGVLRVDVLSRELNIPLLFTGKLSADIVFWNSETGNDEGSGIGLGLRWGAQVALELDWFDPAAARALDEEWGINHTFTFGELYGSSADDDFPLGDTTWALGLGFII